jgi:hypothetical protein
VAYIIAFYAAYSAVRLRVAGSEARAFTNARRVIGFERLIGSFHEARIQHAFIRWPAFISFWNLFYGSFHFIVTVVALVYMFRRMKARYPLWRNTLAFMTAFALIGFSLFPLLPPRLLHLYPSTAHYGFIDTLDDARFTAIWSFQSIKGAANSYAAMPSLHIGWALWCACVLVPAVKAPWQRVLLACYPLLTLFAIVVTANHYWLDALGGAAVLSTGYLASRAFTPWLESLTRRTGSVTGS